MKREHLGIILVLVVLYHLMITHFIFQLAAVPDNPSPNPNPSADEPTAAELEQRIERVSKKMTELQKELSDIRFEDIESSPPVAATEAPKAPAAIEIPITPSYNDRIPVLIISCNRPDVSRALNEIMKHRPKGTKFPIIVSQDCGDAETAKVVNKYDHDVIHIKQPNLGPIPTIPSNMARYEGYYKIARHYKWALTEVFDALMFDQAIIVEDDLEIAPDFFNYFEAMLPLLRSDPTLYCISAWNDNGKQEFISDPTAVYRSDFFPGLGWMMTRELWQELDDKWPAGFWDDWLRLPEQRKDRACIRPEISRTYTFGKVGASNGEFFETHLKHIVLNKQYVDFLATNVQALSKKQYDDNFLKIAYDAEKIPLDRLHLIPEGAKSYRVEYSNNREFESFAKKIGLMSDFKSGVPRSAYLGIVPFKFKGNSIYVVPAKPWKGYQE